MKTNVPGKNRFLSHRHKIGSCKLIMSKKIMCLRETRKNLLRLFVCLISTGMDTLIGMSLKEALVGTGESVEKWEIDEMMHDGDKNQDGFLDYEEWVNFMKHTPVSV